MTEDMYQEELKAFRLACEKYLYTLGIGELRAYGRYVGVSRATAKKKNEIIDDIIAIFSGKLSPIERSKRGAPVRNDTFDKTIEEKMNAYRFTYLSVVTGAPDIVSEDGKQAPMDWSVALKEVGNRPKLVLSAESPSKDSIKKFEGQLQLLNSIFVLLPLDCTDPVDKVVLSSELVQEYDLREGDILQVYAKKTPTVFVTANIISVNGMELKGLSRKAFDSIKVSYPSKKISTFQKGRFDKTTHKFLDWLVPFGKGQRGMVVSAPKAGKSQFLLTTLSAVKALNPEMETYVLLVGQSPEVISVFSKIVGEDKLLYTTYDDDADRQVFVADFLLKRLKRRVEMGKEVFLMIDSINTLSRAYNDTDESIGGKVFAGGLESKTIQYLKKYLGSARQMDHGGSLTILASASCATGNPADDLIVAELSSLCNLKITLNESLAMQRIFPALDITNVQTSNDDFLRKKDMEQVQNILRTKYVPQYGLTSVLDLLQDADSYESFKKLIF